MSTVPELALVARARGYGERRALIGPEGTLSYRELLDASARVASVLLDGATDLASARVAFLVPPGLTHVTTQWGIWRAGGIAVPLASSHPRPELVAAAVVSASGIKIDVDDLRAWARQRLAAHKVPRQVRTVDELPRNAMGKVFKPDIVRLLET